jgi:hypothetical protein
MNCNKLINMAEISAKNTELYDMIFADTVDSLKMETFYKMTQNEKLVYQIYKANDINGKKLCKKYNELNNAINSITNQNILLSIGNIGIYLIFDNVNDYTNMMNRFIVDEFSKSLYPHLKDVSMLLEPYQIILETQKQKIVFLITKGDNEDIKFIRNYCKIIFGVDTILTETKDLKQIIVQLTVNNFQQSLESVNVLKNSLYSQHEDMIDRVSIDTPFCGGKSNIKYSKVYVGNDSNNMSPEQLLIFNPTIIVNNIVNININANTVINGNNIINNNTNMTPKETRSNIAKNWISANLPSSGSSSRDFYNKYKNEIENGHISVSEFTNVVKEYGYINLKSDGIHRWFKEKEKNKD